MKLIEEPILGFNFDNEYDEVKKQGNNEDFFSLIEEDESSGSPHFISKPKPEKKKMQYMFRKEFIELKGKIDQILAAVISSQPPKTLILDTLHTLEERILAIKNREMFTNERLHFLINMAFRHLDVQHQEYHKIVH